MPRKKAFEQTIARAKAVVDFHKKVQLTNGRGRPPRHLSDVLRGALVLTVAGLDAAILDLVCASIPPFAKQGGLGKNVSKWIDDNPEATLRCFAEDDPHKALGDLCRDQLGNRTFQNAKQIEGILRDTLGCEPPWGLAANRLTTKRKKWTPEKVVASLNAYVDRRNRIAHDGDTMPSGKAREIRRDWVEEGILVVEAVGLAAQEIVSAAVRPVSKPRARIKPVRAHLPKKGAIVTVGPQNGPSAADAEPMFAEELPAAVPDEARAAFLEEAPAALGASKSQGES